MAACKLRGK